MRAFAAPPRTEAELAARAEALAGRTLAELAAEHGMVLPADPRRSKGWAGQLLEIALGATAASRAEPDFPHLGVELKTVPVDRRGRPAESTYVCTAPLDPGALGTWETSWVRRKLLRVLWVPLADVDGERVIGAPVLWSPGEADDAVLRADFEELAALIAEGALWQIDGRRGVALHLRPKAADGEPAAWALDEDAGWVKQTARGFYLRPSFTHDLLARHLLLPR
jgi:DNA mismatch repair protein MutH